MTRKCTTKDVYIYCTTKDGDLLGVANPSAYQEVVVWD